ncbi:MAG: alpha/beta fold hydrolase [Eubacteriales bacterium]
MGQSVEKNTEENVPKQKKKKIIQRTLLVVTCLSLAFVLAFVVYVNDYYKAEEIALAVLANGEIEVADNLLILPGESELGIIFYPGAKVKEVAYLPLLSKLQAEGFTCVLVGMPFHLAFFNVNGAEDVFDLDLPVEKWYVAGHSLGGGMASSYASSNPDKVAGLILLGAYVYGDYPPSKALTIYGSYNDNLEENIDYTENIVVIQGGNHAQFGNYGKQEGDPDGDITAEEQQNIAVSVIVDWIFS